MNRGLFITGTDTGVGKTVVTAGILKWLREEGIDAVPIKPVQTGGLWHNGRLLSPDLDFCLAVCGLKPDERDLKLMSPYVYEPACSPHLAGRLAGRYPDLGHIKACAEKLLLGHQALVVEGAGGVMAPIDEEKTMLDLMKLLGYPVVLVARFGLGTINHSLMSIQVLRDAGLRVLGLVFSRTMPPNPEDELIEADNPITIARFGKVAVLGRLRYLGDSPDWEHFAEDCPGLGDILKEVRQ